MDFGPQKFFIGVVDFFSVLMPGALLVYLGFVYPTTALFGGVTFVLDKPEHWLVFFFGSYLLGHFAFLAGSLLDEFLYDPFRKCTHGGQIRRLAEGRRLSLRVFRRLAESEIFFGKGADRAVDQAVRTKLRILGSPAGNAINAFQWSKAWLSKEHPEGWAAVLRFEADSKFFRSLAVVLALLMLAWLIWPIVEPRGPIPERTPITILAGVLLALLALWRYMDQRFKGTQQAYWQVIALDAARNPAKLGDASVSGGRARQAGGLVSCECGESVDYLFVREEGEKGNGGRLRLPRGSLESGENAREVAVRAVRETTGCWARILDPVALDGPGDGPVMTFHRLEFLAYDEKPVKGRASEWATTGSCQWMSLRPAIRRISGAEAAVLLVAEAKRRLIRHERRTARQIGKPQARRRPCRQLEEPEGSLMILHSAEIRWFFDGKLPEGAMTWLQAIAPGSRPKARVDEYILLPGCDTVGVKLRGGHIFEVKALCKPPQPLSLGHGIEGFTDCWIKWSLDSAVVNAFAADLRADSPVMKIGKRRWLVKISLEQDEPAIVGAEVFPAMGCNVEMTELTREGTDWWSFGLEAFGPAPTTEASLLKAAAYFFDCRMPNFGLPQSASLSYPRWLSRRGDA